MSENEEFPFSRTLTDFSSLYRCILVENEYLKNKKEHLKKHCTEYDAVTKDIIYLEALHNEKMSREILIDDAIERGRNTQLILKELKIKLLQEFEMEQDRTAKQKAKHDAIISKYESTLEHYKEIYNKLPLSCEREKLKVQLRLKHIQLLQFKVEIKEIKQKNLLLEQVREQRKQLAIVKLAESYKNREVSSKKNAALLQEVRKLQDTINAKMSEKQQLMYIKTKDRAKRLAEHSLSSLFTDFSTDISSLSIPQLQLPSWYPTPEKIPCLEQRSRNTVRSAGGGGMDTSIQSQSIVGIMTTGIEDILNPVSGFQIRRQKNQDVARSSLPKSMVASQDSSAAKSTQKNKGEESSQSVADYTSTEDNSNEIHSCCKSSLPGSDRIPNVAMNQPQQKLPSDEHMDKTLAGTSVEEHTSQQSSMQADVSAVKTIPVSSAHLTAAKTAWPTTNTTEVMDIRVAGVDILEPTVQTVNLEKKVGPNGHNEEASVGTLSQPVSDHMVLTSQEYNRKKIQNDVPASELQRARNTEDLNVSANGSHYLSPGTDETMSGMDQSAEVGQCQENYHLIASPEDRCSPFSPQADFLMTSPDETLALNSPPFIISPPIHTTNNDLFGAPSNQQSKAAMKNPENIEENPSDTEPADDGDIQMDVPQIGCTVQAYKQKQKITCFTFNFGALNPDRGSVNEVAERGKSSEGFQFNFNNKTSSGSFFNLF